MTIIIADNTWEECSALVWEEREGLLPVAAAEREREGLLPVACSSRARVGGAAADSICERAAAACRR